MNLSGIKTQKRTLEATVNTEKETFGTATKENDINTKRTKKTTVIIDAERSNSMNVNGTIKELPKKFRMVGKHEKETITKTVLVGTKSVQIQEITSNYEYVKNGDDVIRKKIDSKTKVLENYPLKETTREELFNIRKSGAPLVILKKGDKLFYGEITPDINMMSATAYGAHKCATCHRLSALADEDGGCAKVRDYQWRRLEDENYDFILEGYETINTKNDAFVVIDCIHYDNSWHPEKLTAKEKVQRVKALRDLFYA